MLYAVTDTNWGPFQDKKTIIRGLEDAFVLANVKKLSIEIALTDYDLLYLFIDKIKEIVFACATLKRLTLHVDRLEDAVLPLVERQLNDVVAASDKDIKVVFVGAAMNPGKRVDIPWGQWHGISEITTSLFSEA